MKPPKRKSPLAILRAARKLISDPVRWTRGSLARSGSGLPVDPAGVFAERWCALGAVHACSASVAYAREAVHVVEPNSRDLTFVNDMLGHAAVLEILDKAIKRLLKKKRKAA